MIPARYISLFHAVLFISVVTAEDILRTDSTLQYDGRVCVFVDGFGCKSNTGNLNLCAANIANIGKCVAVSFCHASLKRPLLDIAQCYLHKTLDKKGSFLNSVLQTVQAYLQQSDIVEVLLMGYSYGGSVVSRVAEALAQEHPVSDSTSENRTNLEKLRIATIGSIYVPAPARVPGMDIIHFMHVNDVALKCNHLTRENTQSHPHVQWVCSPSKRERKPEKAKLFFGTKEQWKAHASYNWWEKVFFTNSLDSKHRSDVITIGVDLDEKYRIVTLLDDDGNYSYEDSILTLEATEATPRKRMDVPVHLSSTLHDDHPSSDTLLQPRKVTPREEARRAKWVSHIPEKDSDFDGDKHFRATERSGGQPRKAFEPSNMVERMLANAQMHAGVRLRVPRHRTRIPEWLKHSHID